MEITIESFFKKMPVFKNTPPNELSQLAARAKIHKHKKAEFIFQEGEPAEATWWVADGIVKISKLTPDGRMSTMEMLTSVVKILRADIAAFVRIFPGIIQGVLEQVSQRPPRCSPSSMKIKVLSFTEQP